MQDIFSILSDIGCKKRHPKGDILFYEGEYPKCFFVLYSGVIRVYKSVSKTRELTINRFYPVSFVAEMPAFKGIKYPASAVCEEDCEVLEVNFADFKALCLKDSQFSLLMIESLFEKISILEYGMLQNSVELKSRLIRYLLEHERDLSKISQRKMALTLNTRAESLSRIIKDLKSKSLILTHKGKIKILDKELLQDEI
ncbi:MAG: Crp/Fnr family transcriptional regulator [Helicobacter sp.]|nr:Crp/Fnr family transcriptional regulator [Helicobacter sp.]